jgi:LCP family protein required for cell wall assembly
MKTTLKRGIGRAAELNGNGHAVFPPAIGSPVRRYRQPEPDPRSLAGLFGRIFLWLVIVTLMLAAGIAGGTYLYVEQDIASSLGPRSADVKAAQKALDVVIPGEPTTALVLGYDKRAGVEGTATGHSDTLMLIRADPGLETVTMLSFPRDLLVEIQGCKNGPFTSRINNAYGECGSSAAIETVRHLTGVPINFLVTVNFRGFKQVVSRIGGVWVDVDRRYFNDNSTGGERYAVIDLQPGYQKLNGADALEYVRYRHLDSDFFRLARQQQFLRGVKQRAADFPLIDLPKLVKTVTSNVEVGKGDGTRFDARTLLDYAALVYGLPARHVIQAKIDLSCYQGLNEVVVPQSCIQAAVNDFIQPDVDAPLKATDVALNRRRSDTAPSPSRTTVTVLNGNGQVGSATSAASQLGARGYKIVTSGDGNAPSWEYFRTEVYFQGGADDRAAANKLAKLFGDARVSALPADIRPLSNDAAVTVIVGQTYHGTIAAAPADKTPERSAPAVRSDSAARPLLQAVAKRVPYTLMVPTKVEQSSSLSTITPIRVYGLGGSNAVRLTYTIGGIDYWGIQMTDWNDAPALEDPNEVTTIGRRAYRLYYNGSHLHMVVLDAGGATYWVVNSLLDKLSNETMLAIAKGLRPLGPG